jgi:hypothetical protein
LAGQRRILLLVVIVGAALGVVIAGVPSRHKDQPLQVAKVAKVATTTLPRGKTPMTTAKRGTRP